MRVRVILASVVLAVCFVAAGGLGPHGGRVAGDVPASGTATLGSSTPDWPAILKMLASDDYAKRAAAQKVLDLLPEEEIGALRLLVTTSKDEEVKARLEGRIAAMEAAIPKLFDVANEKRESGDLEGAQKLVTRGLSLMPENAHGVMLRGILKDDMGDPSAAIADYDLAIRLDPRAYVIWYNRGNAKFDLRDFTGAVADYTKAADLMEVDGDVFYNRGNSKFYLGDFDGAFADYTRAGQLDPNQIDSTIARGVVYERRRDLKAAAAEMERAIKVKPEDGKGYFHRGGLRVLQGDTAGALADYDRAEKLNFKRYELFLYWGALLYDQGLWDRAVSEFKRGLQVEPTDDELWCRLWLAQARIGDRDGATKDLQHFLDTRKGYKASQWPATVCKFLAGRVTEDALFEAAKNDIKVQAIMQNCDAYYVNGTLRLLAGDEKGAREQFEKALATGERDSLSSDSAAAEIKRLDDKVSPHR